MRPGEVPPHHIEDAKTFLRQPIGEAFRVPMPLRDTDFVNMRFSELAHLLAWYAALKSVRPPSTTESPDQLAFHAHTTRRLLSPGVGRVESPEGATMTPVQPRKGKPK